MSLPLPCVDGPRLWSLLSVNFVCHARDYRLIPPLSAIPRWQDARRWNCSSFNSQDERDPYTLRFACA